MRLDELRQMATGAGGRPTTTAAPPMLRILHCFRSPLGGVFRHVVDLVEAQHAAGHQVGIICDSTSGNGGEEAVFARIAPMLDLGLIRVPMRREIAPSDLPVAWKLSRQVRALNPDILHGHGAKGGAYARAIGTLLRATGSRVARIYTPHGGSLHYDRSTIGGRLYLTTERALARFTDGFILVSEFEREALIAKVGAIRRPMSVVHNGLRSQEFVAVIPAPDAREFLFIGELRTLKGPDLFIGALALLRHRTGMAPSAVIVGSGPEEEKYRAVVGELGLGDAVTFRGPLPVREALTLARTVVVPSRAESMPYVVLETIAAGVPIIATHVGGIPEIFGTAAENLITPNDPVALADAMAETIESPGAAMAKAAALKIRIRSAFTVEAMAGGVEGAYRMVAVR